MGRLVAFLLVLLFASPALAICPTVTTDCVATPIYQTMQAWLGIIGGPWTSSTRPSSPFLGQTGYNSTIGQNETWNGTTWVQDGGSGSVTWPTSGLFLQSTASNSPAGVASTGTGNVALIQGTLNVLTGKTTTINNSLTLTGTDATTMTFPATNGTIAVTNIVQAYSVTPFFNAGASIGSSGLASLSVGMNGLSTGNRVFNFASAGVTRAQVGAGSNAGAGDTPTSIFNPGSPLFFGAYGLVGGALGAGGGAVTGGTDATFLGYWFNGQRASGPLGTGAPTIGNFATFTQLVGQATVPGGAVGNIQQYTNGDAQPAILLSANPITTNASSPLLTINMTNANVALSTTFQTFVCLSGATAVGGITPSGTCTPGGAGPWLRVLTVAANSFTVNWTGNAASGATGGGSAVTVQPSFATLYNKYYFNETAGTSGFDLGAEIIGDCNPLFYQLVSSHTGGQACDTLYSNTQSPTDGTQTMDFGTNLWEADLSNRASDEGYAPDLYQDPRPTIGFWTGPIIPLVQLKVSNISAATWSSGSGGQVTFTTQANVFPLSVGQLFIMANMVPAGYNGNFVAVAGTTGNTVVAALTSNPGTATTLGSLNTAWNWNTVYSVFSGFGSGLGVYDAFSWQQNALVPALVDPTGHGGVGIDGFGAYVGLGNGPIATTIGTSLITITDVAQDLRGQANGNTVYLPVQQTISGVTFGGLGTSYTIANLSVGASNGTYTITGTGTAAATTTGQGGNSVTVMYDTNKPYAPIQFWGDYAHGLIANTTSHFADGLIVSAQPGEGVGWTDGTGTASVTGTEVTPGNIAIDLKPAGTARISAFAPIISRGTMFTATGCTVSALTGGSAAGVMTSGTTGTCTPVVTLSGALGATAPNGWSCYMQNRTHPGTTNAMYQTASSTTTATFSGTTVSGDVMSFECTGY